MHLELCALLFSMRKQGCYATAITVFYHKNIETCLIRSIAMGLWYRFGFVRGSFSQALPDFTKKELYFNIRILYTQYEDYNSPISSNKHIKLSKNALTVGNLNPVMVKY